MKFGQVSYFLIGVLLLLAVFLLASNLHEVQIAPTQPLSESVFSAYVENCLQLALDKGIDTLGKQGGYFTVGQPAIEFETLSIPYLVYDSKSNLLDLASMENELSRSIESQIALCVTDSSAIREQGYTLSVGEPQVSVQILPQETQALLKMPITIQKQEMSLTLEEFTTSTRATLHTAHSAVHELLEVQDTYLNAIPLSELAAKAEQYNFQFEIFYLDDANVLYRLTFLQEHQNLTFNFLANYQWKA